LQCLLFASPSSGCSLTDIQCQCQSTDLIYATATCMLGNCTMSDTLDTAKWQASLCDVPKESKSRRVSPACNIVFALSCSCFLLRLSAKFLSKRLSYDDYFVAGAMVFASIAFGTITEMIRQGAGKHIWDLEHGQLKNALRMFYISGNAYQISLGLVKMSLVALYLQIFQTRKMRWACYALFIFIAISTTAIALATIFSCTPVPFFWNRDMEGKCVNLTALGFANSALAIAQDVFIILVPIPKLHTLHMKLWRKVAVGLMFTLGAGGCVATIIRLRSVYQLKVSIDPTWDYSELIIWTAVELTVVALLASLPSMRIFLSIILIKIKAKDSSNESQTFESTLENMDIALVQIPGRTWQPGRDSRGEP
ncbi:hypothetical protein IQ07DRAFT_517389, partial [Pyrenochaeta sp. DS3sAY3a]